MGKVALCTLETMEPTPIEIIMVPSVTMNGGIFSRETRMPLKKPKARPTAMIRRREGTIGNPDFLSASAADDGRRHHDRPDGKVDPAADDDEGDAHRDEPDVDRRRR